MFSIISHPHTTLLRALWTSARIPRFADHGLNLTVRLYYPRLALTFATMLDCATHGSTGLLPRERSACYAPREPSFSLMMMMSFICSCRNKK
jgi:hypothetical protein